jgi:AraC family L-rhamnose operon transcriptional activator RhaR
VTEEDMPLDTSRDLFHFTEGALAYAGYYIHNWPSPLHSHSFVEIAFVTAGTGTHQSLAGPQQLTPGDVVLLRPGVWHGYDDCDRLTLFNCCFSGELLRRELAWTREDALLGYLLWTGPYSAQGRGMLATRLDPDALADAVIHLTALNALRHSPLARHRGDIVGRLAILFSHLGRAVAASHGPLTAAAGPAHPAVGRAMRMLEARLAHRWTLDELAEPLHLAPGYLVRLFKATTGLPPMAYLARLRAEHAATLLLHSDEPVMSIGQAVGWPDQNYFARRFKAHYGLSATTYRESFAGSAFRLRSAAALLDGASEAARIRAASPGAAPERAAVPAPAAIT